MRGTRPPRFVRHERALWRHTVDAVMISTPEHGEILTVTGAGAVLWDLLAEPQTASSAARKLSTAFDRPAGAILAEIAPVLDDLAARGVIRDITAEVGQ